MNILKIYKTWLYAKKHDILMGKDEAGGILEKEAEDLDHWKRKFEEFMNGRYGMDDMGVFLIVSSILMLLVSLFDSSVLLFLIGCALLVYAYVRIFSRNLEVRRRENMGFLSVKESLRFKMQSRRLQRSMSKTHKYYKCPKCGQKLRVPKGKGKIEVHCPKCGEKFVKKT